MAPTAGHFAWARSTCMMGSCRSCGRLQGRPGEPQGRAAGGPNAPGSPHLASTTWAAPSSRDVALGKRRPLPAAAPGEAGGQEAGGVALAGFRQSTRVCNDLAAAEGAICVFSGVTFCARLEARKLAYRAQCASSAQSRNPSWFWAALQRAQGATPDLTPCLLRLQPPAAPHPPCSAPPCKPPAASSLARPAALSWGSGAAASGSRGAPPPSVLAQSQVRLNALSGRVGSAEQ